jgi:phosphatidate cytidylyltransferase
MTVMDPIATKTLLILIGLFAGAFAVTLCCDLLGRKRGRVTGIGNLWLRYLSWLVIAPLFVTTAYCGNPVFYVFGAAMVMLYLEEFYAITRVKQASVYKWQGRIFAAVTLWAAALADKTLFYCLPVLVITVVVTTPIFTRKTEDAARLTAMTILGILYFAWMFAYIVFIRESFGFGGIVFVCALVTISDVLCFLVGKVVGRHKLIPQVSPGKTIEGALGGIVGTVSASALFKFALPEYSYMQCAVLALILAVSAQLGDLVISAVKRDARIKDTGTMVPGHGGVLDRFDSWIYSMPIAFYAMRWLS